MGGGGEGGALTGRGKSGRGRRCTGGARLSLPPSRPICAAAGASGGGGSGGGGGEYLETRLGGVLDTWTLDTDTAIDKSN